MSEIKIDVRSIFRWLYEDPHYIKVLVYSRGTGKSFAAFDWLMYKLLNNPDPTASGVYYVASLKQTRAIVEMPMQRYSDFIDCGNIEYNKSILQLTIHDSTGSNKKLYFKSYQEVETSRGFHPYVGVFDEARDMPEELYGQVLQPMFLPALSRAPEHTGIVVSGTPRGTENVFYRLFQQGQDPENKAIKSKSVDIYQSGLFSNEAIMIQRQSMDENDFNQECMLDWNANVVAGAIYRDTIDRIRHNNFGKYPHDPMFPVHMAWDLGYTHYTSVWFWQVIDGEIHIIDFFETSGEDITQVLTKVMAKPYEYGHVILPHDADHHNIRSPLTITEIFKNWGLRCTVMPAASITAGIEAVKLMLKIAKFDEENTRKGIAHLEMYPYKYVANKGIDRAVPDQTSPHADAADALRMMAVSQSVWHSGRLGPNRRPFSQSSIISYDYNIF